MGVRAIDVSRWQGAIDWAAVRRDGVLGAWVKVGGADSDRPYRDPKAGDNLTGAQAAGVEVGTYYWCRPAPGNAITQAQHAVVTCGLGRVGRLDPAADIEENPFGLTREQLDRWAVDFCGEVLRLTGRPRLLIYCNTAGGTDGRTFVGFTPYAPRQCRLWIANYGRNTPGATPPAFTPQLPPAWPRRHVWQFNSTTRVPGIPENTCDQNVVDADYWAEMLGGPAPTAPEEDLTMKAVFLPDHTGGIGWQITVDGNGVRRRTGIDSQEELHALYDAGVLEGEVSLTGPGAEAVFAYPEANTTHTNDAGALALAMNTIAYVRERADGLAAQLGELLGRPAGDVDEHALAEELRAFLLEERPGAPGVPAELVDQIVQRSGQAAVDALRAELTD